MICPYFKENQLIFPKISWECPANLSGFQRVSNNPQSDDAWIFNSLWPICMWRQMTIHKRKTCQNIDIIMTCHFIKESLQLITCQKCLNRKSL